MELINMYYLWCIQKFGISPISLQDNANFDKEAAYIIDELGEEFKLMIEAHKILGSKRIAELDYDRRKIEAAMGNIQENRLLTSEAMQSIVYARYNTGDEVAVSDMNQFIGQIILQHGIPFKHRVDRKLIQLFFEVEDKRTSAPEKVGLKSVQRDNVDYEFTAVLDIAMNHRATASKDRTGLFTGRAEFQITPQVGKAILAWCNNVNPQTPSSYDTSRITA